MRKTKYISLLLGLMLAAASCTLSFDEPPASDAVEKPNGDGFTSPRTEQTEFGNVTYQFENGVRVIDEQYVPYIVYCHNDTAMHHTEILFTKNIPSNLLPQRGEHIATTMSELFQSTLCDEVDYVKESQGGYLLTSHPVSIKNVFKEFDFSIDASIAGDYEDENKNKDVEPVQSHSGSDKPRLKGVHLVGRHKPRSAMARASDENSSSETLFSFLIRNGEEKEFKEFELDPQKHKWKNNLFKDQSGLLSVLLPSIREGYSSKSFCSVVGIESHQNIKLDFSLKKGFDLELSNDLVQHYAFCGRNTEGWFAFPFSGSTGMTVPKDGILHENRWVTLDYEFPMPILPTVGIDVKVAKLCLDFNFAVAYDEAWRLQSEKIFKYEYENKSQLYSWAMQTHENYQTDVRRKKDGIAKDVDFTKNQGTGIFQYGSRLYMHIDLGITLGGGTIDISPLRINLDVSGTHKMDNDHGSSKPSTITRPNPNNPSAPIQYFATDKSYEEWKTTLGTSVSTDMKVGSIGGDIAEWVGEYYDWFLHAVASMKWAEGSSTLWRVTNSAFPQMTQTVIYNQTKSTPSTRYYTAKITIPTPDQCLWFGKKDNWLSNYGELQMLIYDENFKFIKSANVTDERYASSASYPYLSNGHEYEFNFVIDNDEMPNSRYFYAIPVYKCGTWRNINTTKPIFSPSQNVFAKPAKYTNRANWGQINGIKTLWVENDDKYCKSGYCLDGVAVDADCFFQASSPSNVHINVEFFDSFGRRLMAKDFEYSTGKNKGGKIKAIYLINHRIETIVNKAKLTLWYENPYQQSSIDPTAKKVTLDEKDIIYDNDTGSWPVFDYANPTPWTSQGYRIGS